jgi:hypothetical protein
MSSYSSFAVEGLFSLPGFSAFRYCAIQMNTDTSNRRYELDWLRVLAILVVFLYHSSRFFNLGDWHVKNINTYVWVEVWNVFATRWMMPLWYLFFLFLYSLICYRLFIWLKGNGLEVLNRITTLFAIPGLMYLWFSISFGKERL